MSTFQWEDNRLLHRETLALLFHCKTVLNDGEDRVFKLSINIRPWTPLLGALAFIVVPPYLDAVESIIQERSDVFDKITSPNIYIASWFDSDMISVLTDERKLVVGKELPRTITCSVIIPPIMADIIKDDMVIRKIKGDTVSSLYLPLPD